MTRFVAMSILAHIIADVLADPDPEMRPPTPTAMRKAGEFATAMQHPLPRRVTPTGAGGLSMEWDGDDAMVRLEIFEDGSREWCSLNGGRLTCHIIERDEID